MRMTWISGWGVPPDACRPVATQFAPAATHAFLPPLPDAPSTTAGSDWTIGWSLGAWRILDDAARGRVFPGRVLLLAPFLAFCSEFHLGGRCSVTQVRYLKRWVQRDPLAALRDFRFRAELGPGPDALPYAADALLDGLDRLAEDATPALRAFASRGLPPNWTAVVGARDPLLDASALCRALPGCQVAPEARHDLAPLLQFLGDPFHAV